MKRALAFLIVIAVVCTAGGITLFLLNPKLAYALMSVAGIALIAGVALAPSLLVRRGTIVPMHEE